MFTMLLVLAVSPQEAIEDALNDKQATLYTRYLSTHNIPLAEQDRFYGMLCFHICSLSTKAKTYLPRKVSNGVLAIELNHYGWDPKVWDNLGKKDPYFQHWEYKSKWVHYYNYPNLDKLAAKVQTFYPIVMADWFHVQTGQQKDRDGYGYYDFLGIKTIQDFQKLVGFNRKAAEERERELATIVRRSGGDKTRPVTLQNRQIYTYDTIGGEYWETRDAKKSIEESNALRNYGKDYKFDASEIYGTLPNDLFAYALTAQGNDKLQETAPDFIAHDNREIDGRVHIMVSCVTCHEDGLRPIKDWGRENFRPPFGLASTDERILRVHTDKNPNKILQRGRDRFAEALQRVNGFTIEENAQIYRKYWNRYAVNDHTLEMCARDIGTTPHKLKTAFLAYAKKNNNLDPVLVGLLNEDAVEATQWEEVFYVALTIYRTHVNDVGAK